MGRVMIIAEAGVNHNGDLSMARQLIDQAADAGADYVKFQTFQADKLASKDAVKADYQKTNFPDQDVSQYEMLKKLELSPDDHQKLKNHAALKNIKFLSTAFDLESIDFLISLGIDQLKIPSGEITNYPYLVRIAKAKLPVILSTGMSTLEEVKDSLEVLRKFGVPKDQITVLHCTTEYPAPFDEVNLHAMQKLGTDLGVKIGYSDHTVGIEIPIAAVAMGATIIEKHFTLNRELPGPDHKASLEPDELKAMVRAIRNVEAALSGDGIKKPTASELKNKSVARKSIYLKLDVAAGEILKEEHLVMQRPGDGISPMVVDQVIGKKAIVNLSAGVKLSWNHLAP